MIARTPHPVFAALWGVLIALTLAAGVYPDLVFATSVLAAIAVLEAVAVVWRQERRDTLSEITTWVNRHLSKHGVPIRGWNSLVAIQAAALGRLVYVVAVGWGAPPAWAFALSALFALGQHDHWLNPGRHG